MALIMACAEGAGAVAACANDAQHKSQEASKGVKFKGVRFSRAVHMVMPFHKPAEVCGQWLKDALKHERRQESCASF
jgi:hypothetical protein